MSSIPLSENEKAARSKYLSYCYGKDRILGEHFTSLIADYFGLEIDSSVQIIQRICTYLRAYTIIDDDLKDTPKNYLDTAWLPLRLFFLGRIREEVHFLLSEGINAEQIIETELAIYHKTSDAYSKRHKKGSIDGVNDSYTDGYADRMATIRIPFRVMGLKAQHEERTANGCVGINGLIKALQLLDDLVDWNEDLLEGRFTYPIICHLSAIANGTDKLPIHFDREIGTSLSLEPVRDLLPQSVDITKQIELVLDTLHISGGHFSKGVGTGLFDFVNNRRRRLERVLLQNQVDTGSGQNLLFGLSRSGAAPLRSIPEKGYNCGHFGS